MKKIIVILFSIMILVVGVKVINNLLNPKIEYNLDKKFKNIENDDVYNYGKHFKTISVSELNSFTYDDVDLHIYYNEDKELIINDKTIIGVTEVYDYFSIYDDNLLIISYKKENETRVLFYNYINNDEMEVINYKDMIIDFDRGITFDDDGVVVSYKLIDNGVFIDSKKDICKSKNKEKTVSITVLYAYDTNYKKISNSKELYSYNLMTYIRQNNLC